MAVKSLGWLAAAAVSLSAVSGMAREQLFARSAAQTPAPQLREGGIDVSPLAVTALPILPRDLQKRDTQTCGYVDGNPHSDYICAHPDAQCLYDTRVSAVGCCLTTSCEVYAACLPYASSKATKTYDRERTLYCSNSNLPSCAVFSYGDRTGSIAGYTIHTCDSVSTTYTIFFRATTSSSSSSTTSSSETSQSSAESTAESAESTAESTTSDSSPTATDGGDSPAETSDGADSDSGSSTPVGPIVGGVIGGVAALALIGLGAFLLIRRKDSNGPAPVGMAAAPGGPPGGPTGYMGGPPGGPHGASAYGPPPASPHSAMNAPVYDPYDPLQNPSSHPGSVHPMQNIPPMNTPPTGSPPPNYQYPQQIYAMPPPQQQGMGMGIGMGMGMGMNGMGTPPPQHNGIGTPPPPVGMGAPTPPPPQNGGYMPYPGPQQQQQQQQQQQKLPMQMQPVELPTQRGDGELHELS
ncbi:hypothetical protein MYCTH_2307766 [Thermothelomyces thermophilus ATCC 42464]|uniref:Mid2 domain-containing protein n=1 Tax=Thermothelomyces thermophilus (strain ATCC 42464 / BCRC 31852 / DSM 1799) TaxID=573729 RepID=G2QGS7_THET4|nr:uncharacterized protein MYCTH_2307766 [Thermothelomyces thermophilus ATCC 42464]AEO59434.1 hypothetical protein MYCTH_2307766 [Thermothelomyces thermophilus ATCC 42464]